MGRRWGVILSGVLVPALLIAGCGGSSKDGSSTSSSTAATSASVQTSSQGAGGASSTPADKSSATTTAGHARSTSTSTSSKVPADVIHLTSPAFTEGGAIPVRYTCEDSDVSPPLRWSNVPSGTAELVLFVNKFQTTPSSGEPLSWAVAGLSPTSSGIAAGTLPSGAVEGRNGYNQTSYRLCPRKGSGTQHYIVALYALPHRLGLSTGFDAETVLKSMTGTAPYSGLTGFTYTRG
jgi:phosphatidylethanolamine-binding protein (PEBP) family uncharacterized protein